MTGYLERRYISDIEIAESNRYNDLGVEGLGFNNTYYAKERI